MESARRWRWAAWACFVVLLVSAGLNAFLLLNGRPPVRARADAGPFVVFNEDLIRGLQARFDVDDPDQVLRLVLSKLKDGAIVFPTENYYYFRIYAAGRTIAGNIAFAPEEVDEGRIQLAYVSETGDGVSDDPDYHERAYSAANGALIKKVGEGRYSVSFQGLAAEFRLNDLPFEAPISLRLATDETYLGPIFDESGIRFSLLFSTSENYFFYLLDDREVVPDNLTPHPSGLLMARRTGFAFFFDESSGRKLLVAVNRQNIRVNNYHDGPFDQIPYNYAKQSRIKDYIERAYPNLVGKVDPYGNLLEDTESKVGILLYRKYDVRDDDLTFVEECKQRGISRARLYRCLIGLEEADQAPGQQP